MTLTDSAKEQVEKSHFDKKKEKHNLHQEVSEVGLFYTLACDIKATDDMIKRKYIDQT